MIWVFWIAVGVIAYSYLGYLFWLSLKAFWRPWPLQRGPHQPFVSVVMVVRNEEAVLPEKLRNLLELDYPPERCEIVVVSDGSTDGTETVLREAARNPRVHVMFNQLARGKASGLNDAMSLVHGEVVIFTDARQKIEPGAVRLLLENFADPEVGACSGELMLGDPSRGEHNRGMGMYWRIEKRVRELEALSGSVVGATGAIYAVRRELVPEVPPETILDDVFIPMNVVREGLRVGFDPRARAWDCPDMGRDREFRRKVRTLTGNYQLLQLAPWLLQRENPLRLEFISHKLSRLAVPFGLVAALISSALLPGAFYRGVFWLQVGFYALSLPSFAGWKLGALSRLSDAAYTLVALNAAAVVAFANWLSGHTAVWKQPVVGKEVTG